MQKPIQILILLLTTLNFTGCNTVQLPVGTEDHVNALSGYLLEYNFQTDFDENLNKKATAKGVKVPFVESDLQSYICVSPESYENLKAFILKYKQRYEQCMENQ